MNITVKINGIDRTNVISWDSLEKADDLNQKIDTLRFSVRKYGTKTFQPKTGDTVTLFNGIIMPNLLLLENGTSILLESGSELTNEIDGTDIDYNGLVLTVNKISEGHSVIRYEVECADNSHQLGRYLVVEAYADTTIEYIIRDLITKYNPGFTARNVSAPVTVKSITFNRITISEAIQKLARFSNYSWYVDYTNDIHFFSRNNEPAPFSITDTSENYIYDSLQVSDDISQLRNRVFIEGGEAEGDLRTEYFNGDGIKKFFKLSNKFSQLPTIKVGGVIQTVGVDFLDSEASFNVLWNFNETYVKFTAAPASGTNNIEVSGIPLYPILVQVEDAASISQYGVHEFTKTDRTIKSKEEAKAFAISELEAYAQNISEGSFQTYTPGLRSGQLISVNSSNRGINESFLIQQVSFRMISKDVGIYNVKLATLKSLTMVDFLINQLRQGNSVIEDKENPILQRYHVIQETIAVSESFTPQSLNYAVSFRLTPQAVTGTLRPFIIEGSPLS